MSSTTTWIGTTSNDWTDPANWSNGVPTYDTTPVINADASNVTIDLKGSQASNALTIEGSGSVTFTDGTLALNGTAALSDGSHLTLNGATLTAGYVNGGTVTLADGASMSVGATTSTIDFGPTSPSVTNTLTITYNGTSVPAITNLSPGDVVAFPNASWNTGIQWVSNADGTYSIYDAYSTTNSNDRLVAKVTLAEGVSPSDFTWDNATSSIVCFLAGSAILTPAGERPVEDLQIGDMVLTLDPRTGRQMAVEVTWAGHQLVTVNPALPDDEAGYPVRILADAIADGIPSTDLLITPEHCLFLEGRFVPARMLVNGRTIAYDRSITRYTCYHVETRAHSVIWANGLTTESYLDTGNRRFFRQNGPVVRLTTHTLSHSWETDAAAPLCVARTVVEPLFQQLEERATRQGFSPNDRSLTTDPQLRLQTDTGEILAPADITDGWARFIVSARTKALRLLSRTSRPSDVIGPFVDDRRNLGVLVGDIVMQTGSIRHHVTAHLNTPALSGWHAIEEGQHRWTSGYATLPVELSGEEKGVTTLLINILGAGPYPVIEQDESQIPALAV